MDTAKVRRTAAARNLVQSFGPAIWSQFTGVPVMLGNLLPVAVALLKHLPIRLWKTFRGSVVATAFRGTGMTCASAASREHQALQGRLQFEGFRSRSCAPRAHRNHPKHLISSERQQYQIQENIRKRSSTNHWRDSTCQPGQSAWFHTPDWSGRDVSRCHRQH